MSSRPATGADSGATQRQGDSGEQGQDGREPAEQRAASLRRELDVLLDELRTRGKRALDVRYQLQKHPAVVAGAGALVLAGVGLLVAQVVRRQRRKHSFKARLAALSALVQERAAAGITAARTGKDKRARKRKQQDPGTSGLVRAALAVALPRVLPLVLGRVLKGNSRAGRARPALAAGPRIPTERQRVQPK